MGHLVSAPTGGSGIVDLSFGATRAPVAPFGGPQIGDTAARVVAAIPLLLGLILGATDGAPSPPEPAAPEPATPGTTEPVIDPATSPAPAEATETTETETETEAAPEPEPAAAKTKAIPEAQPKTTAPPKTTATKPTPTDPRGKAVKRSLASTQWPVEPAFNAGFVVSRDSFAPFVGLSLFVPVWPGVGPALVARGAGIQTGQLTAGEAVVGLGPAVETNLGGLRARATLAPGVLVSGSNGAGDADLDGGSDVTVGPAVVLPLEVGLPLGGGVSFSLTIEPGLSRPVVYAVDGEVAYARDRAFVYAGAGVNFGGPPD